MLAQPRRLSSAGVVTIADLRCLARKRVPRVVFDYIDGGADGEVTLRENRRVFDDVSFRPRHAVAVTSCDLRTRVLGSELSLPVLLAPVGYLRMMNPGGEVAAARAAGAAGTVFTLSTVSGHRLEDVKAASVGPVWYQLYLMGGREATRGAIQRARAAGFAALVVTIDTPIAGMRERDFRNGMKELLGADRLARAPFLRQLLARPGWLAAFLLDGGLPKLPNIVIPGQGSMELKEVPNVMARQALSWADLSWIRKDWDGPIVIKGVITGDDGRHAVDEGAVAVIVSNHGGRQLDCVSATLRALPEVVTAVNGKAEILMDSGIRRGTDIIKAICMGARAVLCGRAFAYGLAAAGEAGVTNALEILRADVERALRLLGCSSLSALDRSYVDAPWL
jgi:isopentenyl diphosphate isomerase/L-lactate dehydrogenase-like FMN-dependent dehydrogenase